MAKKQKWTFKVSHSFVPVPPEKEPAFWAAMDYFAKVMFRDRLQEDPISNTENGEEKQTKEPSSPAEG